MFAVIRPEIGLTKLFIVSHKSYLLVKRSYLLRVHLRLRFRLTTFSETVASSLKAYCLRDRTHEYLSRNLIDNSFEFNWKKNSGMILQFVLIYQSIQLASW
jgi:hypothetical protein